MFLVCILQLRFGHLAATESRYPVLYSVWVYRGSNNVMDFANDWFMGSSCMDLLGLVARRRMGAEDVW